MEQKARFNNAHGEELVGVLHTPKEMTKKAVIICHGFRAGKDIYWIAALARKLEKNGYAALRFDFSGNGESRGMMFESDYHKQTQDLASAIDHLESMGYTDIGVVGHSMGAGAAIMRASIDRRIKTLVDIAGSMHPGENPEILRAVLMKIGMPNPDHYIKNLQEIDILRHAKNLEIPVLILHGNEDKRIPIEHSGELRNILGRKCEYIILQGADHLFYLEPHVSKLIDEINLWISSTL